MIGWGWRFMYLVWNSAVWDSSPWEKAFVSDGASVETAHVAVTILLMRSQHLLLHIFWK